ncbi:MAG: DUF1667 domain-containing protein, partial [Eubacterium sp.]
MTELICIVCPKGCRLKVDENNNYSVTGNTCPRGAEYGSAELKNPVRVVTSTVKINGCEQKRCPVKTTQAIPKDMVMPVMKFLDSVLLNAPVKIGDIAVKNILDTGIDIA